ncbi:MAG TPA: hypothetical protein VL025_01910 [Thermoanaerobaculia bacterium]|nr:hypothetical protein [Thermoanaerobaculia bacterium]
MHSPTQPEELRAYARNAFDAGVLAGGLTLPLPDEPFVEFWEARETEAREQGAFAVLREHMPQLRFPVREGISGSEGYQAATRRGLDPGEIAEATGLELESPEAVELVLYPSPAGRIPLIIVRHRPEFVRLVQALTHRNEPKPVPDSQGAIMIAGYNNWTRVRELRRRGEELRRELYQDRFILLSDGPYSAVPAAELRLHEEEWRELSLVLRRDHECAHYLTRRIFGSMRNNLHDELIADYAGITAAIGHYRAAWFLRFLGLEDFPVCRAGGRLHLYRGDPPLSDDAFRQLHAMVRDVAETVERFDAGRPDDPKERTLAVLALAILGLETLAGPEGEEQLRQTVEELRGRVGWKS